MKHNVKVFTFCVMLLGIVVLAASILNLNEQSDLFSLIFFIAICTISESMTISTSDNSAVSVGFAVSLAVIILFTPMEAAIIIFMGSLLQFDNSEGVIKHIFNTSVYKRVFNSSAYMLGVFVTTLIFKLMTGYNWTLKFSGMSILPIVVALVVYFIMHLIIYIPLFSMLQEKSFKESFMEHYWISRHLVALAPFGILISFAFLNYGWFMVILIFGPLMIARLSFIQYMDTKQMYFETIETLSSALDAKDEYTNGHSKRVSEYALEIAREMGLGKFQKDLILNAALLHDIGKIGIADAIIKKEGKLTLGELYEIKRHPEIGEKIIGNIGFLRDVSRIIRHHHERFDGNGYPDALQRDEIPIEAHILSVADAYDAMTSDRPYREAMGTVMAVEIIMEEAGKQFDPIVVSAFTRYIDRISETVELIDEQVN